MKTKATTNKPGERGAPTWPRGLLRGGKGRKKQKGPRGSAYAFDKARFGEGNARIFLALIWPGFAGGGPDLAGFGSIWIWLGAETPDSPMPRRRALVWPLAPCYATPERIQSRQRRQQACGLAAQGAFDDG
jgi:hypothetical protein